MTCTEEERPCEDRGGDWSDVATIKNNASSHQKLKEAKKDSPLRSLLGGQFDKHLNFLLVRLRLKFWSPEP